MIYLMDISYKKMMKILNKMKKNQKGFTLVEIIVVLVILAILAAFTIPTMLGFVNEAKGKAYIAEAREVYVAAQATATEWNVKGTTTAGTAVATLGSTDVKAAIATPPANGSASLTMGTYLGDDLGTTATWSVEVTDKGKVTKVIYYKGGYIITIPAGGNVTSVKGTPVAVPGTV